MGRATKTYGRGGATSVVGGESARNGICAAVASGAVATAAAALPEPRMPTYLGSEAKRCTFWTPCDGFDALSSDVDDQPAAVDAAPRVPVPDEREDGLAVALADDRLRTGQRRVHAEVDGSARRLRAGREACQHRHGRCGCQEDEHSLHRFAPCSMGGTDAGRSALSRAAAAPRTVRTPVIVSSCGTRPRADAASPSCGVGEHGAASHRRGWPPLYQVP